jgi:hypothetical protein
VAVAVGSSIGSTSKAPRFDLHRQHLGGFSGSWQLHRLRPRLWPWPLAAQAPFVAVAVGGFSGSRGAADGDRNEDLSNANKSFADRRETGDSPRSSPRRRAAATQYSSPGSFRALPRCCRWRSKCAFQPSWGKGWQESSAPAAPSLLSQFGLFSDSPEALRRPRCTAPALGEG